MSLSQKTIQDKLSELIGFILFTIGVLWWLSLLSYSSGDVSWNTAGPDVRPENLIGRMGAYLSDFALQALGLSAFLIPLVLFALSWKWMRKDSLNAPAAQAIGIVLFVASASAALALTPRWMVFDNSIASGGVVGYTLAQLAVKLVNPVGAGVIVGAGLIISLYLTTKFSFVHLTEAVLAWSGVGARLREWKEDRSQIRQLRRLEKHRRRQEKLEAKRQAREARKAALARAAEAQNPATATARAATPAAPAPEAVAPEEIPIRTLEDLERIEAEMLAKAPAPVQAPPPVYVPPPVEDDTAPWEDDPAPEAAPAWPYPDEEDEPEPLVYHLPPATLLNEPPERYPHAHEELKEVAAAIKAKLEEFKITGSVVQINPGPVVTTYEYKPDAGIKYSRVTTLNDDLCLGLRAESVLIERIPNKHTIGLEVPNSRREIISLRQILESSEFIDSPSPLTICLGKDIAGRIKVAALDSMPHLLIAGSTGSGKSVMINSLIMSILHKSTPNEVRMILIDPKRLEMGLYDGVPHLLTPVITDARQATNALRNALIEMEQRLRLLASKGVRNIDQFNRKIAERASRQATLFDQEDELQPLPYIVIIIDEFADLMMLERANAEGCVTRLAQMARAVGIHLVVATQRPSVDVITGLIKANFPSRLSFRVATRVDSRTILDRMGAEHLLGRGDMLFLPPGSSRLVRVHGAFVTEPEIERVVEFWKRQAQPEYDESFLAPPPGEVEAEGEPGGGTNEPEDPLYREAVKVICEAGKASTSILQRRLKLGYGRAARILDMMQSDGVIGPPDGSRPRQVLKPPDWLDELETWPRE